MSTEPLTPDNSAKSLFEETSYDKPRSELAVCGCVKQCGYRWTIIGLLALGMVVIHAQRVNTSVSLLAVYDNIEDKVGSEEARKNLPKTSWTALQISLLHSSFFIGYLVTQIPAGIASYQLSAHRTFGGAIFVSCGLNLILPTLIDRDLYPPTIVVRAFQGLAEGFLWPACFVLVNNWSPRTEVCRISGFVATGSYAGAIIGFPLCGFLTHYVGWQYIYYTAGGFGLLWSFIWLFLAYDKPDHHPKISEHELSLLTHAKAFSYQYTSIRDVPWKSIATSKPFIAMCSCAFAKGWVFNLLLMQEPTYIHVFGLSIAKNGLWSALPFFFKLLVCYGSGFVADMLVNKLSICRTRVRKTFNTLGFGVESICLFSLSFIYDGKAAIAVLSTGISLGGLAVSGWQTNHLDLAPQLAGILVALTQMFSNIAGIFSPMVAGYFIQESGNLAMAVNRSDKVFDTDIYGWHMVFLICSLIVGICCAIYVMLASGEEQEWAKLSHQSEDDMHGSSTAISSKINVSVSYQTIKCSLEDEPEPVGNTVDITSSANNRQ